MKKTGVRVNIKSPPEPGTKDYKKRGQDQVRSLECWYPSLYGAMPVLSSVQPLLCKKPRHEIGDLDVVQIGH